MELRLAERARTILHEVHLIHQEFQNDPYNDTRPFHFATGATTLIYRLGGPLRIVRKRFPKTDVSDCVCSTIPRADGSSKRTAVGIWSRNK